MSTLTWRDVAAPDFSNSLSAINSFGRLFGDAIDGGIKAVGKFDNAQDEIVNREAMARALAIQDSGSYKDALASGSILDGLNRSRISTQTLGALDARRGTLLNEDLTGQQLTEAKYNFADKQERDAALKAAAPIRQKMALLMSQGKQGEAQALASQNADLLGKLRYDDFSKTISDGQAFAQGDLNYDVAEYGHGRSKILDARTDKEYDLNQSAQAVLDQLAPIADPADKLSVLTSMQGKLPPAVFARALAGVGGFASVMADLPGLSGSGGGGGGIGGAFTFEAPQQAVASTFKSAGFSDAGIAGLLGNFHVEGGYGGAVGDGGKAAGIAQWRDSRRDAFIKRNGIDPSKAPIEMQAQHAVWELTTAEGRKVAGISEADARAIMQAKDPRAAAALVDAAYERSSGQHRGARMNAAAEAAARLAGNAMSDNRTRYGQDAAYGNVLNGDPASLEIASGLTDNTTARQVAITGVKEIPGANANWLESAIVKLQRAAQAGDKSQGIKPFNLSARAALAAIKHNSNGQAAVETWGRLVPDVLSSNAIGDDLVFDQKSALKAAYSVASGDNAKTLSTLQNQQIARGQLESAIKARDAAQARLQQKSAYLQRTGAQGSLVNETMAVQQANALVDSLKGAIRSPEGGMSFQGGRGVQPAPVATNRPAAKVDRAITTRTGGRGAAEAAAASSIWGSSPKPAPAPRGRPLPQKKLDDMWTNALAKR